MRLSTFLDSVYILERSLSPDSIRQLRMSIRLFEEQFPGVDLTTVSHEHLNRWIAANPRGWAPKTLKRRVADVMTIWSYASETGYCETVPARKRIRRVNQPRMIPDAWTLNELARMRDATDDQMFRRFLPNGVRVGHLLDTVILAGFYTALRASDLRRILRSQLSAAGQTISQGKCHGDQVVVCVPEWLIALIDARYPDDVERVWAWPYRREYFYALWRQMLRAAGLRDSSRDCLQKLRRTAVSFGEAVKLGYGSQLAGHRPGSATTYTHYVDPRIVSPQSNLLPDLRPQHDGPPTIPFRPKESG